MRCGVRRQRPSEDVEADSHAVVGNHQTKQPGAEGWTPTRRLRHCRELRQLNALLIMPRP